jgi:colanic acid biosynthesis glycosyl transferase WcaI
MVCRQLPVFNRHMKILLVNQFFWPDSAPTGQLLTDLAHHLRRCGHEVTVICGNSAYAEPDQSAKPDVRIIRVGSLPFGRSKAARVVSYLSFLLGLVVRLITLKKADLIVTLTTPPLLSPIGTILKGLWGARHYIWEMDVYPDVAVDLNVLSSRSWVVRILGSIIDYSRRRADGIIALGECMRQRLIAHGIPADKIAVAENWADGRLFYSAAESSGDSFTVLYSGNLGLAHDIDTIHAAMKRLKDNSRFHFIFSGGGPRRRALEQACDGARNVSFLPYRSRDELARGFSSADVGLVTQNAACLGSIVPSKVYGLMAAGRPFIFVGPIAATPSRIIERFQCGWRVDCGDSESLVELLQKLANSPEMVWVAGRRARQAFLDNYDVHHGVSRICAILEISGPVETFLVSSGS